MGDEATTTGQGEAGVIGTGESAGESGISQGDIVRALEGDLSSTILGDEKPDKELSEEQIVSLLEGVGGEEKEADLEADVVKVDDVLNRYADALGIQSKEDLERVLVEYIMYKNQPVQPQQSFDIKQIIDLFSQSQPRASEEAKPQRKEFVPEPPPDIINDPDLPDSLKKVILSLHNKAQEQAKARWEDEDKLKYIIDRVQTVDTDREAGMMKQQFDLVAESKGLDKNNPELWKTAYAYQKGIEALAAKNPHLKNWKMTNTIDSIAAAIPRDDVNRMDVRTFAMKYPAMYKQIVSVYEAGLKRTNEENRGVTANSAVPFIKKTVEPKTLEQAGDLTKKLLGWLEDRKRR